METSLPTLSDLITQTLYSFTHLHFLVLLTTIILVVIRFSSTTSRRVYLVDFRCHRPPASMRVPVATFLEHVKLSGHMDDEGYEFYVKVLERSGIEGETCMPDSVHELPADMSLPTSRREIEAILFPAVADLLAANEVSPKSIDVVVSNCSLFCPTPSISEMVVNRFGLRSNVLSYSLGGMGCSAGLLAVSLVRDLMRVHKECLALVLSMEAVSPNGYYGNAKSMILTNCLFRMGGAAILLSNRKRDRKGSKYVLQHLVRTHLGHEDRAYSAVFQEPDDEGIVGVSLSRALLHVAGDALKRNIATLGPLVLPYSEQIRYAWSVVCRRLFVPMRKSSMAPYLPEFKKAFEHFCIHAGGRAVIEAIEERLELSPEDVEASKMTLYRFGNTSSSSVWYELSYLEAKGKVRKGDWVWQIGFGSGFKCNSAVWKCVSDQDLRPSNVWYDIIHMYPVDVPDVLDH